MADPNLYEPEWDLEDDSSHLRGRAVRLAQAAGAHRIANPGPEPARVLLVSTQRFPEVAEHVTTGTLLALTAPGEGRVFAAAGERSFPELFAAALAADAEIDQRGTSTS